MPAMRRWRDYTTKIVHAFNPTQITRDNPDGLVIMQCGEPLKLTCGWSRTSYSRWTQVPSGKRLTEELPSVKTQVTCLGCLAEA